MKSVIHITLCLLLSFCYVYAQKVENVVSIQDSINKKRQNLILYGGSAIYGGLSTGLYLTWYKKYDQRNFHFFDDAGEWRDMDKAGHVFSAYLQSDFMYQSLKWAGVTEKKSIFYGALAGMAFQTTIEVMDGFSSEWGFSAADMLSNVAGVSSFVLQQKHWGEQRIRFKMSSWPKKYSTDLFTSETGLFETSIQARSETLFGNNFQERFLKDYNAQTIWLSVNPSSFMDTKKFPEWLAIAVGYSAENMFGGYSNSWEINDENIIIDPVLYPRYSQFILALDYDLSKIKTKSPFLKTVLGALNGIKFPAPAIEYNTLNEFRFYLVFRN